MKEIKTNIKDFSVIMNQASDVLKQSIDFIEKNYRDGGQVYNEAIKTAKSTFYDSTTPLKIEASKKVKEKYEKVRKQIADCVAVVPSDDVLKILPFIGKTTPTEQKMIIDAHKGNYIETKLLCEAIGDTSFKTVESILKEVENLERATDKYFRDYNPNTYHTKVIEKGHLIESVANEVDAFINTYSTGTPLSEVEKVSEEV